MFFSKISFESSCCDLPLFYFRIIGFATCTGIGFLLSTIGTLVLFGGFSTSNLELFAVLYVLGNIICKFTFLMDLPIFKYLST